MSNKITIEKSIPKPPEGWEFQDRQPNGIEESIVLGTSGWGQSCFGKTGYGFPCNIYAYRVRDEYAERYEALKLPDGWAWISTQNNIYWSDPENWDSITCAECGESIRRIINGKAVKP